MLSHQHLPVPRVRAPHGPLGAKPTEQVNVGAKAFRKHLRCSFFIFQNN